MNADTNKFVLLREGCGFLARVWKQTAAPVSHVESVFVNGRWVRITIEYDPTRNGDKPMRRAGDKEGKE
jgi:hypothetical protein